MKTQSLVKENTRISGILDLPAVSIIMPFQPMMSSKSELENKLKLAVEKVETQLMNNYAGEKALPVVRRLTNLLTKLNYNTHKKSIAIFVSSFIETVYYLDILVEERIATDSFEIRDLINSKKKDLRYLVLLLSSERSKMYEGDCSKFVLIKSNVPENIFAYKNDIAERVSNFSDPDKRKEILLDKFLHHMDEGLSLVLNAYNLPVFVLAPEKVLGHFKKITRHAEKLVAFISGNYDNATETEIRNVLQPYLKNWTQMRVQAILQDLENAKNEHKLSEGIHEVEKSSRQKNSRLLVVEKDFAYPPCSVHPCGEISETVSPSNLPFYIRDTVDSVIEKVLQNGGDVEFVENGMLKDYDRIALIKYY
jgi:hypothetical protein